MIQAGPAKKAFFLPAFVARILTPRSRKSDHGLLLGCRSELDEEWFKRTFIWRFWTQKPGKSLPPVLVPYRNRSGVVELVGTREGALDVRESQERWTTWQNFADKNAKILDQKQQFCNGEFSFFWPRKKAGKTNFGGGGVTSKLASQWPSRGIYKHAPPGFWRKRCLLYWEKNAAK